MVYDTLFKIVDQLEFCDYTTRDGEHDLKSNVAFIALKEMAERAAPETKEYFVTFLKNSLGETAEFKEVWDRKKLDSKLAYDLNIKVIGIKPI